MRVAESGPSENLQAELDRVAPLLQEPERHGEAEKALRDIVRRAFESGQSAIEFAALNHLTSLYYGRSEYEPLLGVLDALLEAYRKKGDAAGVAKTEFDRGAVLGMAGQSRAALAPLRRALAEFERQGNRGGIARAQVELAGAYTNLGRYERARSLARTARRTYEALGDRLGAAEADAQLGYVFRQIGDHERALTAVSALRDALADTEYRRAHMDAQADVAASLKELDRLDEAKRILVEVVAYYDKAGDVPSAAKARVHLAGVHVRSEAFDTALAVLKAVHGLGGKAPLVAAYARKAEGDALLGSNRAQDALASFRSAGRSGERLRVPDLVLEAGQGLARAELHVGDADAAMRTVKDVALVADDLMARLGDLDRITYRRTRADLFETGLRAALTAGEADQIAWFLELGRGSALQAGLGARAILGGRIREATRAAVEAARKALAGARMRLAGTDRSDDESWGAARQAQRAAEEAYASAWKRLQDEAYGALSEAYTEVTTLAQMKLALRAKEAFVLFGVLADETIALVLDGRFKAPRVVRMETKAVERVCGQIVLRSSNGRGLELDPKKKPKQSAERRLAEAAKLLLAPLKLPADVRRLYVSPQGGLATVPWNALVDAHGAKDIVTVLIPSVGTYRFIAEDRPKRGKGVLGLGDPTYRKGDAASGTGVHGAWSLPRLEATRAEVTRATKGDGSVTLLGADATKEKLLRALRERMARGGRYRSVHLACHGLVDRNDPLRSALALTPASTQDDGLLTVPEVFETPLATDLVVLSACDTGLGRVAGAEGLRGFARAFLMAGAPRVIVSLWPVDDKATGALMKHFYDRLDRGASPAQALIDAQRWTRAQPKWKHPRFWAGWVLWGLAD